MQPEILSHRRRMTGFMLVDAPISRWATKGNPPMDTDPRTLYDEVCDELTAAGAATRSQMFGMPCLKRGSKAFAGFTAGAMVFKLGAPDHAAAMALPGAHLFDPMHGRPMKEWVVIPVEHAARWTEFGQAARRYVAGAAG
jgi:hypothetical protein